MKVLLSDLNQEFAAQFQTLIEDIESLEFAGKEKIRNREVPKDHDEIAEYVKQLGNSILNPSNLNEDTLPYFVMFMFRKLRFDNHAKCWDSLTAEDLPCFDSLKATVRALPEAQQLINSLKEKENDLIVKLIGLCFLLQNRDKVEIDD